MYHLRATGGSSYFWCCRFNLVLYKNLSENLSERRQIPVLEWGKYIKVAITESLRQDRMWIATMESDETCNEKQPREMFSEVEELTVVIETEQSC